MNFPQYSFAENYDVCQKERYLALSPVFLLNLKPETIIKKQRCVLDERIAKLRVENNKFQTKINI